MIWLEMYSIGLWKLIGTDEFNGNGRICRGGSFNLDRSFSSYTLDYRDFSVATSGGIQLRL